MQQVENRKRAFEIRFRQDDINRDGFAERVAVVGKLTESHVIDLNR